jgi:hypothetical protein
MWTLMAVGAAAALVAVLSRLTTWRRRHDQLVSQMLDERQ